MRQDWERVGQNGHESNQSCMPAGQGKISIVMIHIYLSKESIFELQILQHRLSQERGDELPALIFT
jgi:hypothetical protein